jgi:REP element-mobilizing transposase RayT
MPHRTTPFFVGGYYHIFNRGNNREPIFFERENYHFFLRQLQKYLIPAQVEIVAYCLMPNHYHLLVNLVSDDLSRVMQPFALSYSKAIAKRYSAQGLCFRDLSSYGWWKRTNICCICPATST